MLAGEMAAGSVGAQVLALLADRPQKFWARWEILRRLAPPRAVGWALWRAQRCGWIEAGDDARNERYMRWRITPAGLVKLRKVQGGGN